MRFKAVYFGHANADACLLDFIELLSGGCGSFPNGHFTKIAFTFYATSMPNSPSAKKRLRQNEKQRLANRTIKSAMRTQIRKVHEAVQRGDMTTAEAECRVADKRLDRAGATGVIHRNTAARTKSRLQQMLKKAKTTA